MYNVGDAKHIQMNNVGMLNAHTTECPKTPLDAIDNE